MKKIVSLLKELIRFRTTLSRPEELEKCTDFIESYLAGHQISCIRYDHNGTPSVAVWPKGYDVKVLLMSHMDVVEAPDHMFEPVEKNGNLYGRGTIDDKYAAALTLLLYINWVEEFRKKGADINQIPFGLLITGDEETGGNNGAGYVLAKIKPDLCIALDGGSADELIIKEKGPCKMKLTARGKSAHGARPWLGVNAIDILMNDLGKLKKMFDDETDDHWHKTLSTGIVRAGSAHNLVPDCAEAWLDVRVTENDDIDEIIQTMDDLTESKLDVEMNDPVFFGGESDLLDRFCAIHKGVQIGMAHGASDAKFLMDHGIPGFIWGANGNMTQHSEHEHVELKSIQKVYDILDRFFRDLN